MCTIDILKVLIVCSMIYLVANVRKHDQAESELKSSAKRKANFNLSQSISEVVTHFTKSLEKSTSKCFDRTKNFQNDDQIENNAYRIVFSRCMGYP